MKFKKLVESYSTDNWEEIDSKNIKDSDGSTTDYTWYEGFDEDGRHLHIFMFGDKDVYYPDADYADFEVEVADGDEKNARAIAQEWFDNYTGFNGEEDEYHFSVEGDLEEDILPNSKLNMSPNFNTNIDAGVKIDKLNMDDVNVGLAPVSEGKCSKKKNKPLKESRRNSDRRIERYDITR